MFNPIYMNSSDSSRYQKRAVLWQKISVSTSILFGVLLGFGGEGVWLFIAIIGFIFSLVTLLAAWLFKRYYHIFSFAIMEYEKLPLLAEWMIPAARWGDYQHIEQEHRKRGYIKYILWSPLIIVFLAIMIWAEVDELPFDLNLLWWGIPFYGVLMVLLYFQMKRALNKTNVVGDHHIQLKRVGATIDGNITLWGKLTADTHTTLGKSMEALLFAKSDEERKVNKAYIHEEGGLQYVVINYNMDENNQQMELFLPLPNDKKDEVSEQLTHIQVESVFTPQHSTAAQGDGYHTKKYLSWIIGLVSIISAVYWVFDQGLPMYHQWHAEQIFDEALALEGQGAHAEALKKYKKSVNEFDLLPGSYLNMGIIFLNEGSLDSALYYFNLGLIVEPGYGLAMYNRGVVYYNQGEYRTMIDQFYSYEKATPDNHDHDLMMGDGFYNIQLIDSEFIYYQRATTDGKQSGALSYMMGRIMADKRQWSEALVYLDESIKLDSVSADSYLLLSEVQHQLGNDHQADDNYSKGIGLLQVKVEN